MKNKKLEAKKLLYSPTFVSKEAEQKEKDKQTMYCWNDFYFCRNLAVDASIKLHSEYSITWLYLDKQENYCAECGIKLQTEDTLCWACEKGI